MKGEYDMRKYDNKNKKYIGIIIGIGILLIIIFFLFLRKVIEVGKIEYKIASNSVVFDIDKNMYTTEDDATVKVKWSGNYYMLYDDSMYNLGNTSVIYNKNSNDINLYGKFYEVLNTGDVNILENETVIESSVKSHFYKIDDRKYLIVDRLIESDDGLLVTSNYLLVNIDKSGNATLLNNDINLKTFGPTILKTSSYTFDVANEKLNFGGEDIDLKDIIGSTNQYDKNKKKSKDKDEENEETSGVSGNGTGSSGDTTMGGWYTGNADTTSGLESTYNRGVSDKAVSRIINATKNTSVIRVTSGITSIGIDYVVYDPNNEYQSVYVEVVNSNYPGRVSVIDLSKNDTHITINNLEFNTLYYLTFYYTYYDNSGSLKNFSFDSVEVNTRTPSISLKVTGIMNGKLYYRVSLDNYYNIVGGNFSLFNGSHGIVKQESLPSGLGSTDEFTGTIDVSNVNFSSGDEITLSLDSLRINLEDNFNPNVSFKFIY